MFDETIDNDDRTRWKNDEEAFLLQWSKIGQIDRQIMMITPKTYLILLVLFTSQSCFSCSSMLRYVISLSLRISAPFSACQNKNQEKQNKFEIILVVSTIKKAIFMFRFNYNKRYKYITVIVTYNSHCDLLSKTYKNNVGKPSKEEHLLTYTERACCITECCIINDCF